MVFHRSLMVSTDSKSGDPYTNNGRFVGFAADVAKPNEIIGANPWGFGGHEPQILGWEL